MSDSKHTPEFVAEMRSALLSEKELLKKRLASHSHIDHGDFQADYPDYGRSTEENADEVADFITTTATIEAEEARLKEVLAALKRINDGTYGVTAAGDTIPEARLRANPAATTTVADHK